MLAVWRHRQLLRRMAERDLRQRYAGSTLGPAWAAIHPLIFVGVYAFIFTFVFRARLSPTASTAEYGLYILCGMLPWVALNEVATKACQTMAEHRNLVKHIVFPTQVLPLTSLYATAFSQSIGLAAVLLFAIYLRGGLSPSLLLLLVVLPLQVTLLAGVSWVLGAAGAVFRDVKEVVQIVLMVGMFVTPIFYLERDVPPQVRALIALNPITHLVRLYRDAMMGSGLGEAGSLLVFALVALATAVAGFLLFERVRVYLSDVL
jgi:lipopolysaccharide transport system permease protein